VSEEEQMGSTYLHAVASRDGYIADELKLAEGSNACNRMVEVRPFL
jgi:hypothetical protein